MSGAYLLVEFADEFEEGDEGDLEFALVIRGVDFDQEVMGHQGGTDARALIDIPHLGEDHVVNGVLHPSGSKPCHQELVGGQFHS
jgi:hypothetical protein